MGIECSRHGKPSGSKQGEASTDRKTVQTPGDIQDGPAPRIPGDRQEGSAASFLIHTFLQCASPGLIDENKVVRSISEERLPGCGITGDPIDEVNSFIWTDETLYMACYLSMSKKKTKSVRGGLGLPKAFVKVGQVMVPLCINEMKKEANVVTALQASVRQTHGFLKEAGFLKGADELELDPNRVDVDMMFAFVSGPEIAFVFGDKQFIAAIINTTGVEHLYSFVGDKHKNCCFPGNVEPTVLSHPRQKGSFLVMCHGDVWATKSEAAVNALNKHIKADDVEQQIAKSLSPPEAQRAGEVQAMVIRL